MELHIGFSKAANTQVKMPGCEAHILQSGVDKTTPQLAAGPAAGAFKMQTSGVKTLPGISFWQVKRVLLPAHHPPQWTVL